MCIQQEEQQQEYDYSTDWETGCENEGRHWCRSNSDTIPPLQDHNMETPTKNPSAIKRLACDQAYSSQGLCTPYNPAQRP